MYTSFYGLREKPFALSPDPRFLYLASSHREALAHLLYGIEQGEGFISVTGEVGTGKTTLCRTLLERLDGDTELAFLFNPSRTAVELLQSICAEFELPAEGLARRTLMNQLNNFLLEQKQAGRRVLLIIDEAQTLTENTLEQVRLLSNLETSRDKLIQILLLGQPELDRKLDGRGLRQLRQRISVRWQLEPLGADETIAYVRHRLSVAAGEPKDLFTEPALREIHKRTGGIPRLVNQLCDRALLAGYAERAAQIGPDLVRAAAAEIPDTRLAREAAVANRMLPGLESLRESYMRPWMWAAASLAVVGLSLFAGLQVGRTGFSQSMRASLGSSSPRDPGAGIPPSVGANSSAASRAGVAGAAAPAADGPPISDLIAFVPRDVRDDLRPTPGQVADGIAIGTTDASGQYQSASLTIPSADAIRASALAPGLLPDLLQKREVTSAFLAAESALLGSFGRRVASASEGRAREDLKSAEDLRERIESRGLAATTFEGGSIRLLRQLDHPVALPLAPSPGAEPKWITVTGFFGDRAQIAGLVEGRIVTVSSAELEAHWLETGIIVWERFERVASQLRWGDTGGGVTWLQHALSELRVYTGRATGKFDDGTYAAVARFQREQGLVADGVAGPLTQIALYARLLRYPVPRLSESRPTPGLAPAPVPSPIPTPAVAAAASPTAAGTALPASPAAASPSTNEPKKMRAGATPHSSLSGDRG